MLVDIRSQWNNNIIPTPCANCTRHASSNRWYSANGYTDTTVDLIRIDYWTGDTCNLTCAICGPYSSSAWKTELKLPVIERKQTVNYAWKDLDLTKLKYIHFNGGEPLLSKEHVQFLMAVPNKDQVHINYNTNGTIQPSDELLELWSKFKLVQIDFSIDDIEERFEYQRYPAEWNRVTENLQWFIDTCPVNCMFAVNTTVSVLNVNHLDKLNSWLADNFYTNRVTDPIEYRQQMAVGLFSIETYNDNRTKIVDFLNKCDQRRGTNWLEIFPELVV
jgi:MoaA/NifB/PqqE/SkfB family radical SAM enzyme